MTKSIEENIHQVLFSFSFDSVCMLCPFLHIKYIKCAVNRRNIQRKPTKGIDIRRRCDWTLIVNKQNRWKYEVKEKEEKKWFRSLLTRCFISFRCNWLELNKWYFFFLPFFIQLLIPSLSHSKRVLFHSFFSLMRSLSSKHSFIERLIGRLIPFPNVAGSNAIKKNKRFENIFLSIYSLKLGIAKKKKTVQSQKVSIRYRWGAAKDTVNNRNERKINRVGRHH